MHALGGTLFGRWYVTLFGITFAVTAVRHLGWRRTVLYAFGATVVGVIAENSAVRYGVPYTRYSFEESLRGEEIWVGNVPLMVSLSYTFMGYFAFAAAKLVVAGPRRSISRMPVMEFGVAVMLSTWALWVLDPVSRLGEHFFLGRLFAYDGPGFWFGLPAGSQLGFAGSSILLVGLLTWMTRHDVPTEVQPSMIDPRWSALGGYAGQVTFMAVTAFWVARTTESAPVQAVADSLAGSALVIYLPMVLLVAVHWRSLALLGSDPAGQ